MPNGRPSVYSLAGDGPFGPAIRAESVAVERQTGYAARDLRSWAVLRWMIPGSGQGTVHAFGLRVLRRLVAASIRMRRPRIVLSLTGRERLTWFDRRCLRSVSRIVVPYSSAADALTRQGALRDKVSVIPLAVGVAPSPPDRTEFCRIHGLPTDAKLIMTAGWMNTRDSLFGAVWAFEFLRYIDENVRLLVIGDGPARETIRSGAIGLAPEGSRVHFLGAALGCTGRPRSRRSGAGAAAFWRRECRPGGDGCRASGHRGQHAGSVRGDPRRRHRRSRARRQRSRNGSCDATAFSQLESSRAAVQRGAATSA